MRPTDELYIFAINKINSNNSILSTLFFGNLPIKERQ